MEQMSLFEDRKPAAPLASRLRPASLKEFVGQTHLLGEGKVLKRLIDTDQGSHDKGGEQPVFRPEDDIVCR